MSTFNAGDLKEYLATGKVTSRPYKMEGFVEKSSVDTQDAGFVPYRTKDGALFNPNSREIGKTFLKTTLAKHDAMYHKNGYKPGDECNFREKLMKMDDADTIPAQTVPEIAKVGLVEYVERNGKKKLVGVQEVGRTKEDMEANIANKAARKATEQVDAKVSEKVEEQVDAKVEKKVDEKVDEKVSEKVEKKLDEKIEEKVDQKMEESGIPTSETSDSAPEDIEKLAEHDEAFHPGGFDPTNQTCEVRECLKSEHGDVKDAEKKEIEKQAIFPDNGDKSDDGRDHTRLHGMAALLASGLDVTQDSEGRPVVSFSDCEELVKDAKEELGADVPNMVLIDAVCALRDATIENNEDPGVMADLESDIDAIIKYADEISDAEKNSSPEGQESEVENGWHVSTPAENVVNRYHDDDIKALADIALDDFGISAVFDDVFSKRCDINSELECDDDDADDYKQKAAEKVAMWTFAEDPELFCEADANCSSKTIPSKSGKKIDVERAISNMMGFADDAMEEVVRDGGKTAEQKYMTMIA